MSVCISPQSSSDSSLVQSPPPQGGSQNILHTLPPLYAAYRALVAARTARGTLDLDLPERQVSIDRHGKVTSVAPRPRLDSHRLIEEFMVLANVAAAEELEQRHQPCMYRARAAVGGKTRIAARLPAHAGHHSAARRQELHPRDLDRAPRRVADTPEARLVNEVMLAFAIAGGI